MSYDFQSRTYVPDVVVKVLSYNVSQQYIINGVIVTDANEYFYTRGGWVMASELKIGSSIYDTVSGTYVDVASIAVVDAPITVYDLVGNDGNNVVVDYGYLADSVSQ